MRTIKKNMFTLFRAILVLLIFTVAYGEEVKREMPETSGRQDSHSEIDRLLNVLSDERLREHEPDRVIDAIVRLGELRPQSPDAIETLLKLLEFKHFLEWERRMPGVEIRPVSVFDRYPAAAGLAKIGRVSVPHLLEVIAENDFKSASSLEEANASYIALQVFQYLFRGDDWKKGRSILVTAVEEADSSSLRRQRLIRALKAYDDFSDLKH